MRILLASIKNVPSRGALQGLAVVACATALWASASSAAAGGPSSAGAQPQASQFPIALCPAPAGSGAAGCDSWLQPRAEAAAGGPPASAFYPADLRHAYGLPAKSRRLQTIAVVNAYGAPTIQDDLKRFSSQFGLPSCTTTNHCLRMVGQTGSPAGLPAASGDWPAEAALGVETVHGICTNCHIVLVETDSSSVADLTAGVDTAARLGANEVAVSFVTTETVEDSYWAPQYNHPGVVIAAAAGDHGYDVIPSFPASLPDVVAVGATHLNVGNNAAYRGESAWNMTGTGCSSFFSAAAWQASAASSAGCGGGHRAVADVSADGDPATGAAVYTATTIPSQGRSGWFQIGGTSMAAPLIAGVFALAGGTPAGVSPTATLYAHRSHLHDVTSGSSGQCGGKPICQAGRGYDGPTGLGSPNGLAAFAAGVNGLNSKHPGVTMSPSHVKGAGLETLRLTLSNSNPFKVMGTVSLASASRLRYPGRRSPLRIVAFGKHGIAIAAGKRQSLSFALSPSLRSLIARAHQLKLIATVSLRDAHGRRATARLTLSIH